MRRITALNQLRGMLENTALRRLRWINVDLVRVNTHENFSTAFKSLVPPPRKLCVRGFSLVELLCVLSIISLLSFLAASSLQAVVGTQTSSEVSDFASTLARARAYAMANNTYVFVGIQEVDASVSENPGATQLTGTNHYGRIAVSVVASNNGTSGYLDSSPATVLNTSSLTSLTTVAPLRNFNNLHIVPHSALPSSVTNSLPNSGSGSTTYWLTSSSGATSLPTFTWPLTGTAQYSFGNNSTAPGTIIQYNPQGEAQIITGAYTDSILQWIEIDLEPTHGNQVPAGVSPNTAAILIDGASGAVNLYRS